MKRLVEVATIILVFALGFVVGYKNKPSEDIISKVETVTDTVKIEMPVHATSNPIKTVSKKLPTTDTLFVKGDTILKLDSIFVEVPISQKVYKDSLYTAWVSGYLQNLDSIQLYRTTKTITIKEHSKNKWAIGPQVGITVGNKAVAPYIGVGISYNIFSW